MKKINFLLFIVFVIAVVTLCFSISSCIKLSEEINLVAEKINAMKPVVDKIAPIVPQVERLSKLLPRLEYIASKVHFELPE